MSLSELAFRGAGPARARASARRVVRSVLAFTLVLPALVGAAFVGTAAQAAPPKAPAVKKEAAAPKTDARLQSSDEAQLQAAFDDVRAAGPEGAALAPAVAQALLRGLPPKLAEAGLDTLGEVSPKDGLQAFVLYTHHRSAPVRRAAVRSLGRAGGPEAIATLRRLLRDGDPAVRGLSALALGQLRSKEAVPDLYLALDHRVPEAGVALGRACDGNACDGLLSRIGAIPFAALGPGLEALLQRPATEVDDTRKLRFVARLRELGTHEGHELMKRVATSLGASASPALAQALREAIAATEASP